MKQLTDIKNRNDIEHLVNVFYDSVKKEKSLNHFFDKVNWKKHLPIMVDFWENVLFYSGNYMGNPMEKHKYLNEKMTLTKAHFDCWLSLFSSTVDALYAGPVAEQIKQKAYSIASVMQSKILH